jgi:hypothetical protein
MNQYGDGYQYYPQSGYQQYPADQAGAYYANNYSYPGYQYPAGYQPASGSFFDGWFDFKNPNYIKGLLLAAGVTLLVTNPTVQKTVITGLAKAWSGLQYGVEEVKEQINDIKAEMQYKQEQKAAAGETSDA